jgi:hypothetical protein
MRDIMTLFRCHRDAQSLDIFISYLIFNVVEWEKETNLPNCRNSTDDNTKTKRMLGVSLYASHDRLK